MQHIEKFLKNKQNDYQCIPISLFLEEMLFGYWKKASYGVLLLLIIGLINLGEQENEVLEKMYKKNILLRAKKVEGGTPLNSMFYIVRWS